MTNESQIVELDMRRKGQELAVAWRKGRAAYVLESLSTEQPLRAALIATLIHEALARWDPYDSKWPTGFRRALLTRSQGWITPDEIAELEREYRRRFGASPPQPSIDDSGDQPKAMRAMAQHASRLGESLRSGRPLQLRRNSDAAMFLRPQAARR